MWKSYIITYFPEIFPGPLNVSIIKKALADKICKITVIDIKKYAEKKRVDDTLCAGGAGMLLKADVFEKAFEESIPKCDQNLDKYYLSPRGPHINQKKLEKISRNQGAIFLCGRFEGVDSRILTKYGFEEISIGDFVVCGGDIPVMLVLEGVIRLLEGVVGNSNSIENDSFQNDLLECNNYTKPIKWQGIDVPNVLLSGDWKKINDYKLNESKKITKNNRPDLWAKYVKKNMSEDL